MQPVKLPPNQVRRFYRGGPAIARFRGIGNRDEYAPEEWIGSVTSVFGSDELGVSRLPDGTTLRDAIAAEPELYLGERHVERFGSDPALLVKLLDAGERLPVHFHPDGDFACRHLGSRHGKTEAWIIIGGGGTVHVGFREDVESATVAEWVARQDAAAMLDALHPLVVAAGDTIYVPGGTPHAIGAGILLVELQEPTDLSVLLEWDGFAIDGAAEGHLGLGFDRALAALDRAAWTTDRLDRMRAGHACSPAGRPGVEALFPDEADAFFRAERVHADGETSLPASFSLLIVLEGDGELTAESGEALPLARGEAVLVPFAAGDCRLAGPLEAIRCLPPAP